MSTQTGNAAGARAILALVFDRHAPSRVGFGVLLRGQSWVQHVVLAASQDRAVELARRHRPDVAVIDISTLGPFVAPLVDAVREAHRPTRIVLSSRCAQTPTPPLEALRAAGFLAPDADGAAIVAAVEEAAFGTTAAVTSPSSPAGVLDALTARERDVLMALATGATNREIAVALHIAPDSVKKHCAAIYRKLAVRNRTEATRVAASLLMS